MKKNVLQKNRWLVTVFFALLGAVLFVNVFGSIHTQFKGLMFDIHAKVLKPGSTLIEIPPVGLISAATHSLPLEITISLNDIDLAKVMEVIETSPEKEQLATDMEAVIHNAVRLLVFKIILLATAGGFFGVFLIRRGLTREHLAGALGAAILFSTLIIAIFCTYNTEKFYAPQFKGILEAAPWMVSSAEKRIADLQAFRSQITTLADNINDISLKLDNIQPVTDTPGGIRVLHVSDIHNSPVAFDFILKTADAFGVDFIVDTGDICDLGTPLETLLLDRINKLEIPYLFVPGNHDTPQIISALEKMRQVTILTGEHSIKGLTVAGIADPTSNENEVNLTQDFDWGQYLVSIGFNVEACAAGASLVEDGDVTHTPDIIAVHNPDAVQYINKKAPVILTGHTHKAGIDELEGSLIIHAGTTGGAGLRGLQYNEDIPYTAVLLHFTEVDESGFRLVAADTLRIDNIAGQLNLQRNVFPH